MTRGTENALRRALNVSSLLLLVCGFITMILARFESSQTDNLWTDKEIKTLESADSESADPRAIKLSSVNMTKTRVTPPIVAVKPLLRLETLIRVKGVFKYSDQKDNEALIENILARQTKNFRVGEIIPETNAVIVKIDDGVTFNYNGGTTRIEIRDNEHASAKLGVE